MFRQCIYFFILNSFLFSGGLVSSLKGQQVLSENDNDSIIIDDLNSQYSSKEDSDSQDEKNNDSQNFEDDLIDIESENISNDSSVHDNIDQHDIDQQDSNEKCVLAQDVENELPNGEQKDTKTSFKTTFERVVLKTIVETFWTALNKEKPKIKEYKVEDFEYFELGKVLSNFFIDEIVPNARIEIYQKLIELLVPVTISFLILEGAIKTFIKNKDFTKSKDKLKKSIFLCIDLGGKLFCKLMRKLFMVRFLQKPGTPEYQLADILAIGSAFHKENKEGKSYLERYFSYKCIDPWHGIEQVILDQIRVHAEIIDLGKNFNPKHRKKALGKILQIFLKPRIQEFLKEAYDYRKNIEKSHLWW
ncbi:hypothetical protein GF322_03925 [Candidatus Dependentiae bacterium]|nr:hypothetical protein [Candidatus Dependentiae bacterium]